MSINDQLKILHAKELAKYLHVHMTTIYRLVRRRQIPFFMVASSYRFNRAAIDAWMRELEVNGFSASDDAAHPGTVRPVFVKAGPGRPVSG